MTPAKRTVDELLKDLYRSNGTLTPEAVVDAARPETSPLHRYFTWADTEAARKYRLLEAAHLIRTVRVERIKDEEELRVRLFYCERDLGRATPGSYISLGDIQRDPEAMNHLLGAMRRDWLAFKRRWSHMQEWRSLVLQEADDLLAEGDRPMAG